MEPGLAHARRPGARRREARDHGRALGIARPPSTTHGPTRRSARSSASRSAATRPCATRSSTRAPSCRPAGTCSTTRRGSRSATGRAASRPKVNLVKDVEDMRRLRRRGHPGRFARKHLELTKGGIGLFRMSRTSARPGATSTPNRRRSTWSGRAVRASRWVTSSSRRPWEASASRRAWAGHEEAGPDGAEVLAFGAPLTENKDAELEPGWWPEAADSTVAHAVDPDKGGST